MKFFKIIHISVIMFIYLYAIVIRFFPIGLDKIIFIYTFSFVFPFHIRYFIYFIKKNKELITYLLILLLLFAYSGLILIINTSYDFSFLYSLILRITVFYFPIIFILFYIYRNFQNSFMSMVFNILVIIIAIQSFFVILSFFNLDFKLYIDSILPYIGNIGENRLDRMRGFSNGSGATLSLVQGIGAYITLYLLINVSKFRLKLFYLILIILDLLSLLFIGRSGLILFLSCGLLYILLTISVNNLKNLIYFIVVIFIVFYIIFHVSIFLPDNPSVNILYEKVLPWAFELFENFFTNHSLTTESNQQLWAMIHWPNNIKTILIGDGIFERSYTLSDSGYVRYMYNFGIVGIILLIFSIFYIYYYSVVSNNKYLIKWITFLIIFVFLFDIKEPFLLKPQLYPLLIIILFTLIIEKKKYAKNNISN